MWWRKARRFEPVELATLQAIGQQVGLLLRSALLLKEADSRRQVAEAAEARYRSLLERVPAGVWRTTPTGQILEANPALAQMFGYPDRAAFLALSSADLYVNRNDRERLRRILAADGVADFTAELRRADGAPVWVRMQVRAEAAERQAEALRYVAHLANAAAHEINNPLSVITGRLELVRRRLAGNDDALAKMDTALEAARRIAEIIAHMGRITRLEVHGQTPSVPPMLDIRGSGPSEPR